MTRVPWDHGPRKFLAKDPPNSLDQATEKAPSIGGGKAVVEEEFRKKGGAYQGIESLATGKVC